MDESLLECRHLEISGTLEKSKIASCWLQLTLNNVLPERVIPIQDIVFRAKIITVDVFRGHQNFLAIAAALWHSMQIRFRSPQIIYISRDNDSFVGDSIKG